MYICNVNTSEISYYSPMQGIPNLYQGQSNMYFDLGATKFGSSENLRHRVRHG